MKFDTSVLIEKSVEKIQVSLKSDLNNWVLCTNYSRHEQTEVVQKIKTHILCSITFSRKSCRLLDNVVKYGTAIQATDDNTVHAICMLITRVHTHTHNQKVYAYCFSTVRKVTRTVDHHWISI